MCETDSWWEAAVQHRELSLVLCDDLEGWDEDEVGGRLKGEDTCVLIVDLPCCTKENNTTF